MHFDLQEILKTIGYFGIFFVIFAESGLFFGFFLPGDSLIFTAGFLASQGYFNVVVLLTLMFIAAVTGDSTGYWFGKRVGKKIFSRDDSIFFHKHHLVAANDFYNKHGGKTIILARFVPAVRTFAPIVAGAADMHYKTFLSYNLVGGFIWTFGLGLSGYFLGRSIPDVDKYLLPIVLLIIFVSVLPGVAHIMGDKNSREALISSLTKIGDKFRAKK